MEKLRPEQLREKANMLPLLPGVYIMLDEHGEVIYIGKAKALKNRVTSYFRGEHLPKVAAMVAHVADFNVIVVQSEFEALVLENSLIKLHKPKYNILLKDDKGYPFVRLDSGDYPRFTLVNRTADDGAKYYGPFGGRHETRLALDAVCAALRLPTCSRRFPRDIGKERPCLNFHMGRCDGFCRPDGPGQAEYQARIRQAVRIFSGHYRQLTAELQQEMEQAAEELNFTQSGVSHAVQALEDELGITLLSRNRGGVVLTADGYILTNYHVIKGAQQITVTANDGSTYAATLVGTDEDNDIAVLKVDAKDLTPAILGDSDTLKVGDAVLAIGNPLGTLSGTVTDGIVSALERQVTIDGNNMTLLQTSAAVNPGNSGGGLFNASGELIGIVNAKSTSDSSGNAVDNIGFAIPINSVKTIIEDLISHGYVTGQIINVDGGLNSHVSTVAQFREMKSRTW